MACTLTPAEKTLMQARLDEAKQAYHDLVTGTKARVIVDQNGEKVEFTAPNRQALYAYNQELERILCPSAQSPSINLMPMRFTF